MSLRFTVLGNPVNRRVTLFADAVRAAGLPAPDVLPWREAAAGRVSVDPGTILRVDSPGEDAEVDRLLRRAATPAAFGEIVGLAAGYRGMCATVRAASQGATTLNDPGDIAALCDKRFCHARLSAAGVPVPSALPGVTGYQTLRAAMAAAGWSRVFVKPAHGSSASGVIALALGPRGQLRAVTAVEVDGDRLFNSLRVREYREEAVVASIVDRLAGDGLHVERWYPKAVLAGRPVDLRVLVTAGRPNHVVVRLGRSPMTNLHLGGARGEVAAVRAATGDRAWAAGLASCVRAAGCFRGSLHVAVDLMFHRRWHDHAIAEVNAFGDLLPGVLYQGRDSYRQQIHAIRSGQWATWRQEGQLN